MANPLVAYVHKKKRHRPTLCALRKICGSVCIRCFLFFLLLLFRRLLRSLSRIELSALGPERSDQNHHFCSVPAITRAEDLRRPFNWFEPSQKCQSYEMYVVWYVSEYQRILYYIMYNCDIKNMMCIYNVHIDIYIYIYIMYMCICIYSVHVHVHTYHVHVYTYHVHVCIYIYIHIHIHIYTLCTWI